MKNITKKLGIAVLTAAIVLSLILLAACGDGGGGNGSGNNIANTEPTSATYTGTDGTNTYKLVINKAAVRAAYTPQKGDSYILTIIPAGGTSTGTVQNITGSVITLKPGNSNVTFTFTVEGSAVIEITGIITLTDNSTVNAPDNVTPGGDTGDGGEDNVTPGGDTGDGGTDNDGGGKTYGIESWTSVNSTLTHQVECIAYVGGKFIAGDYDGKMASSLDGVTWKAVANPIGIISDIAYGGGKFIVVDYYGKMAYSLDGETWTAVGDSQFNGNPIYCITYANGRFVAGGENGRMAYSSDGINWTGIWTLGTGSHINSIAYGGTTGSERFVAVAASGSIIRSSDGANWDMTGYVVPSLGSKANSVVYGGDRFVAVCNNGIIGYSSNGITWTVIPSGTSTFGTSIIYDITYGNNMFVAVGGNDKMAYSTDGINWTATNSPFTNKAILSIAYGNGRFVIGSTYGGGIAYSSGN